MIGKRTRLEIGEDVEDPLAVLVEEQARLYFEEILPRLSDRPLSYLGAGR